MTVKIKLHKMTYDMYILKKKKRLFSTKQMHFIGKFSRCILTQSHQGVELFPKSFMPLVFQALITLFSVWDIEVISYDLSYIPFFSSQ